MSLRDHWSTGQLRDIVQKLFTFLSGAARTVYVKRLTLPLTEYERFINYFSPLQGMYICFLWHFFVISHVISTSEMIM